jgi:hypothetical protein
MTQNTTTAPRCETLSTTCAAEREIGIRVRNGHEFRLCTAHATDLYDSLDPTRRGGRVELFDL